MAKSTIDIIISTILKKTGIDAARAQMADLARGVGKNLMNIKAGFDLASEGIRTFVSAMSKGMEFERLTTQFKSLTGSMEAAKAHMKDLQDLGRTPPFSLEQFAAASQEMLKMTGGMAGFKKEMETVGDLAAATGNDIAAVGRAFGLAYQMIRDGRDFGRAGSQLVQLGILTKAQVERFNELSKSGADNMKVWEELSAAFSKYKGAMAETEKTTKGLVEAIQGEATVAMTEFSTAVSESAKPALEGLLGWMKRINEDGTIEDWADRVVERLGAVGEAAKGAGDILKGIWKTTKAAVGTAWAFAAGADQQFREGKWYDVAGQVKAGARTAGAFWRNEFGTGEDGDMASEAKNDRAVRKQRKRSEQRAKMAAEAEKRIEEDMSRAKAEADKKRAEEKARADAEAAAKAIAEEQKAREKMEADLHRQRIANLNDELKAAQAGAAAKQGAISSAQSEFDKAFAMYRSEDKGAAQIAEERDYAKDYKQLQKDAARYGGKWRIDELSSLIAAGDTKGQAAALEEWRKSSRFTPEVESMVRAAAADQTRTTAEDELRKISANTESLSKKLDELLQVK